MYSTLCQLRVWIQDGMKTEKRGCMMRRGRRRAGVFRAAAFSLIWGLALSAGITAWAETDEYEEYEDEYEENAYAAIDSVTLEVYTDIRAGDMYGDVEVSGDEDGYTVDKVELVNEPKMGWEAGDRPKVQVTLEAGAAYYFSSGFSRSDIILEGDEGSVSSIQKKSSTLWVTITLEALDEEDEEEADEDDSKTQDNWSKAQTGSGTVSASDDSDPSYGPGSSGTEDDWEEDAWEDEDSEDADWQSSGMSGSESRTYRGAWLYDGVGWWYCYAEGGYPVNGWLLIDDCWYYFDGAGYMATGWIFWNGQWYFCSENGDMLADTVTPDGYYVGADGAWKA